MTKRKTPGVYISEKTGLPNSVVEAPTSIPVFLGYTETAQRAGEDVTGVPVRIDSYAAYTLIFGGPARDRFSRQANGLLTPATPRHYLDPALRMFFLNGGGDCWIVSLGDYAKTPAATDYTDAIWHALRDTREPALIAAPDAVALPFAHYVTVSKRMLAECALQSRFAILDLPGGAGPDLAGAIASFRKALAGTEGLSFAATYAPWLNTTNTAASPQDMLRLDPDSRRALKDAVTAALPPEAATSAPLQDALSVLASDAPDPAQIKAAHETLTQVSPLYRSAMEDSLKAENLLPPCGVMAGLYAQTDTVIGVWKAPVNIAPSGVVSPSAEISTAAQEGMNMPPDGLALNAIRSFAGQGSLVWGARTLDANSLDWRYIAVRRTVLMLETSIKIALEAYILSANDAVTWSAVTSMIEAFLTDQWKRGALAGNTAQDAFDVSVGLGSTMTAQDILDGLMRVTVRVAPSRPAEFMVLTFEQQMTR